MNVPPARWLRRSARLCGRLCLGLLVLAGLCLALGVSVRPAHAQTSLSVTDCSSDAQLQAEIAQANHDNAGDDITFACSGDIKLTSTLSITGNMTLDGSGQQVTLDGGGSLQVLYVDNGASFSGPSLTLNALTIAHGSGDNGGGLSNVWGTVTISASTFVNNSAGDGGGLYTLGGTVTISNSTFADNLSVIGAGLYNWGTVTISNSTFADNQVAGGGFGAGLYNIEQVSISNSTIADNSADFGAGLLNRGQAIIRGSIVADNAGGDCYSLNGNDDQGYNLDSDGSCGFTSMGSLQHTDPKLNPSGLQDNGGPTQTIALQQGSPASDQIPLSANICPSTDQRGDTRPDKSETTCDMGAYEFSDPVDNDLGLTNMPTNITVDATSPQGAIVTYTPPTVVDEDSPLPAVNCSPASGSTFAIGSTTVTCTASDSDDANSPVSASFTVTVNGAETQGNELIATLGGFNLPGNVSTSYLNQLQAVQADISANNTAQACSDLTGFINHVKAQSGKQLTVSQANQLVAAAKQIQAVLGC